jgi:hypothetical protein
VEQFAFAYWWLIFPIMWFIFGMFGMWMAHRRHRDTIDLMKTYAAQGKDPAEIAKAMNGAGPGAWGPGPWGGYGFLGSRWRVGPYWEWRRFVIFACMSVGFWFASRYAQWPGTEQAFTLVAIIMGVLAAGSFLFAVMTTLIGRKPNPNE